MGDAEYEPGSVGQINTSPRPRATRMEANSRQLSMTETRIPAHQTSPMMPTSQPPRNDNDRLQHEGKPREAARSLLASLQDRREQPAPLEWAESCPKRRMVEERRKLSDGELARDAADPKGGCAQCNWVGLLLEQTLATVALSSWGPK